MVSKIGGVATGAASGALAGSSFGPIGAGIGGIIGGIGGFFGSKGEKNKIKQIPTQSPQQQVAQNQILQQMMQSGGQGGNYNQAQNYYSSLLGPDAQQAYNQFASPYNINFEQNVLPRLSERFSALGGGLGGGTASSSGFGQAIGGASAQHQAQLENLFAQLRQGAAGQATNQYNSLASLGLGTNQFDNLHIPGNTGAFGPILGGFSQGAGQSLSMNLGNNMMNWGQGNSWKWPSWGGGGNDSLMNQQIDKLSRQYPQYANG